MTVLGPKWKHMGPYFKDAFTLDLITVFQPVLMVVSTVHNREVAALASPRAYLMYLVHKQQSQQHGHDSSILHRQKKGCCCWEAVLGLCQFGGASANPDASANPHALDVTWMAACWQEIGLMLRICLGFMLRGCLGFAAVCGSISCLQRWSPALIAIVVAPVRVCANLQEMAVGAAGLLRVWGCFQPVLVPPVPAPVRCPGPYFPISPAGSRSVTCVQQGTPITVSKSLYLLFTLLHQCYRMVWSVQSSVATWRNSDNGNSNIGNTGCHTLDQLRKSSCGKTGYVLF